MPDDGESRVSYPYMTAGQWNGLRAKFRQSLPNHVDVDWIMAALGTSEKSARNIVPQLKAVGLITRDGKPVSELVHNLRDDGTYASACKAIRDQLYPAALLSSWDNPEEDADKVAAWFMRNAGTGAATATMQAKFYLLLLKGELPSPISATKATSKRTSPTSPAKKTVPGPAADLKEDHPADTNSGDQLTTPQIGHLWPNLHIDMQIHISADASDIQIDTIFKSMAKHLYGRD